MKLALLAGTTDVTVYIYVQDTTAYAVGGGLTGLVFNSAGLTCYYVRPLGNATVINLANQTVTGAHTDGGFKEVDATNMPGVYRLDLPDAVCATAAQQAVVLLKGAANMAPVTLEIQLSNVPGNVLQIESADATDQIRDALVDDATRFSGANIDAAISSRSTVTTAQVNAECDTALADYDGPTNAEMIARTLLAAQYGTAANQTNIETDTQDIQTRLPAALVGGAMDSSVSAIDAVTANKIADHTLRRSWANAWASADGDAASFRSLLGAVAKLVNRVALGIGVFTIYEDDDATPVGTQTVTTNAAAAPITELDTV